MEEEIGNFIKVLVVAIMCGCYCYTLSRVSDNGVGRLVLVAPVIFLFTTLPFSLYSAHFGTITFCFLAWLANFKLLLFAFNVGPLASLHASLPNFVFTLLLPINPSQKPRKGAGRVVFGVKLVALPCVIVSFRYMQSLPYPLVMTLHSLRLYLAVEITLAIYGAFARALLGLDLSPPFNEPLLTTSLQDFWGNRWNLLFSDVLRLTVYNPARNIASMIIGRRRAKAVGTLATFLVSGLMHEFIYYHATRVSPTWEVTCFFILHGACTATEMMVKRAVSSKWRLHRVISGPLTLGFVVVTAAWLFFPQLLRNDVPDKVINEYPIMVDCFKRNVMYWL